MVMIYIRLLCIRKWARKLRLFQHGHKTDKILNDSAFVLQFPSDICFRHLILPLAIFTQTWFPSQSVWLASMLLFWCNCNNIQWSMLYRFGDKQRMTSSTTKVHVYRKHNRLTCFDISHTAQTQSNEKKSFVFVI